MGLTKAWITNEDSLKSVECLFNPSEYTIDKTVQWQPNAVPGRNVPTLSFLGGGSRTLKMELFFDTFEAGEDVRKYLNKLWKLAMIDESKVNAQTGLGRPPICIFQWGPSWSFRAALTSISVRYTLFREDGTPARATASVTFTEGRDGGDAEAQKEKNEQKKTKGRKMYQVKEKETLATIARTEYGNSAKWRLLANANDMDNPEDIAAGKWIIIPPDDGSDAVSVLTELFGHE